MPETAVEEKKPFITVASLATEAIKDKQILLNCLNRIIDQCNSSATHSAIKQTILSTLSKLSA